MVTYKRFRLLYAGTVALDMPLYSSFVHQFSQQTFLEAELLHLF